MKKSIFIPLLFVSIFAFAQGSKVSFKMSGGSPGTTDPLTQLELPLNISFTADFNGKELILKNNIDKQKFNDPQFFGAGDLKFHRTGPFVFVIAQDNQGTLKTNPGENNVPSNEILLTIANKDFILTIKQNPVNLVVPGVTTKSEEYSAGYVYYDALKLADTQTPNQKKIEILKAYKVNLDNPDLNPFLKDVINTAKAEIQGGGVAAFATSLGNTDVTYFAEGLARFLAERTKEELNEAFFSKMKEQLNAVPELKTAFPKTASFLDIIETYSYASVIQVLKEAFETDVQNLPENLYNIKSLTKDDCDKIAICGKSKDCNNYTNCQTRLEKLSEFFVSQNGHWVALGMFSVKEGIKSTNPADLLKAVVSSTEFTDLKSASASNGKFDDYNIASSIELSNVISQSLISKDDKQVWISTTQLKELFSTKDAFKIYLGLLLAKELKADTKVEFYDASNKPVSFGKILFDNFQTFIQFENLIRNTYSAYNAANNAVKKMIAASEKSVAADPQALYDYYRTFTSSLKPIAHNLLLSKLVGKDIGATYDKVEQFLNPSVDIAYHISTKKYSAAIYDASILLSELNDFKVTTKDKDGKEKQENYNGFKPVTKSFMKYGTLISTVANAQSSDEVKQALDASVLPVGSYSIKRKTKWSFSINAYVGAYCSYSNTATSKDYLPSFGLTAPVGFNISRGLSETGNCGGFSLNLQIIDVGALVNYYLLKGDTASIPNDFKVRLSNIFSPGFNLCYNIPKTPLAFAWGGQYIPTLYKYELINGKNELTPTNAWRWQLSLLVDIPMFNLKVWDFDK